MTPPSEQSQTPDPAPARNGATWYGTEPPPPPARPGLSGWLLIATRGLSVVSVLLWGLAVLMPLRGIEQLFSGPRRPVSGPWVQIVCRACLWVMGIGWSRRGTPMRGPGAVVANHTGWLDIFVLNAAMPVFFVSKAEVAGWPGINVLTRVTNTHFVVRDPRLAQNQTASIAARIRDGHRLLFFPEGTSTDGRRVLPFKTTLFQAFFDPTLPADLAIQPVSACYRAADGRDPRFHGWWGDMALGPHLLAVLAAHDPGQVTVTLHPPVPVSGTTRKGLAATTETAVREGLEPGCAP